MILVAATPAAAGGVGALYCDEYALSMADSLHRHGQNQKVCFELSVRSLPVNRGYLVVAGLEPALAHLEHLRFSADDLAWLAGTGAWRPEFVDWLASMRFTGDVEAIAEGTVAGAGTPLLRLTAPRIEATLVEGALLAMVNHETTVASKTARIVEAAAGRPVYDFSLRRLQGPEAGPGVARGAYIAGAAGTATVIAGRRYGIPTTGTMAHHFVLSFGEDGEQLAFEQFLRDHPERAALLVDTYDTLRGVHRAVAASQATGVALTGVRLDSGDIDALARRARAILDAAGMQRTGIIASNELDEWSIRELVEAGAPVDSFGVGTRLGTSADAPSLSAVYKLVAQWRDGVVEPVMKRSASKSNDPGVHQVWRERGGDLVGLVGERRSGTPLLEPVMRGGRRTRPEPSLTAARERCRQQREALPAAMRRLDEPATWPVRRSRALEALRGRLTALPVDAEAVA
ncbi:MAG: nicotinate phosphoribosyltransferase [Candidatus Dormibacteria bacterium]